MPAFNPAMQKAHLADVQADVHGLISKKTAEMDGVAVTEVTFQAGARWSNDLKAFAGTDLCELPHVALVMAGTLRVVLRDISQQDFSAGDVMLLPRGTTPGLSVTKHAPSLSSPRATTTTARGSAFPDALPAPGRLRKGTRHGG